MKILKITAMVFSILVIATVTIAKESFKFEHITDYTDGNWIVTGIIKNQTNNPVQLVYVELQGEDKDGNLVLTDTTYAFAPIHSGASIPFRFLNTVEKKKDVKEYSVRVASFRKGSRGTFEFKFEPFRVTERNDSFHKWSSRITNSSGQNRQFIEVALMGFDKSGNLIYMDTTYPNSTTLKDGGKSVVDFLVTTRFSQQIDKYRVIAFSDK
ncbi:hypothetical protein J7L05_12940 [bacterium]|nr:hypothetical protein [bacterium]